MPAPPLQREAATCCVCFSTASHVEGVGVDFEYRTSRDVHTARRCDGCGVVFLDPRPQSSEFERIYPSNYHSLDFSAEGYGLVHRVRSRLEANRLLRYCQGAPKDARILDVGCGDGFHLDLLRRYGEEGWRLEGMDVDHRAIEGAVQRGLFVRVDGIEEPKLEEGAYDVVYSIQTIEHLGRPDLAFRSVERALKPGGRFVVVTDNTDSLDFSLFRRRHWGGYHFPRHWYLFNRRSLAELATRTGFRVVSIDTIVSPVNWVYSLHNALVDRAAPDWLVRLFTLKSPVSLAVFTLLDIALSRLGRGALLNAVFEKPMAERDDRPLGVQAPREEGLHRLRSRETVERAVAAHDAGADASSREYDTVVVGAGQAGVSLSYFLRAQGTRHVLLERDTAFSSWRNRWDDFYSNTPNWMNTLPRDGFKTYPGGDPRGFALKDELVDYFDDYLQEVGAPIHAPCEVSEARQERDGTWVVQTSRGEYAANNLAVCTGAMSSPRIPRIQEGLDPAVAQIHSLDYRNPGDIRTSRVLIVGSGSSGVQICRDLCKAKKFSEIHLATSNVLVLPERVLGIQVHRFVHTFGLFDVRVNSALGRVMYGNLEVKGDPIRPPTPKDLGRSEGVLLHGRLTGCESGKLRFDDGSTIEDGDLTVLWCTGYRGRYDWIHPQEGPLDFDERGYPIHERGVVESCSGLYFVGLRYQYTVASHDIYGVGRDARYVAQHMRRTARPPIPLRGARRVDRQELAAGPAQGLVG